MHEAERCVPRLEFLLALEEADNFAVLGIRGHPVPVRPQGPPDWLCADEAILDAMRRAYDGSCGRYQGGHVAQLEAGRLSGEGYWYGNNNPASRLANELLLSPTSTPEEYQVGLQLAEACRGVVPDDPNHRILVPIAIYRLGRYAEALPLLESWQREWERIVLPFVGQAFLLGWRAPLLLSDGYPTMRNDVWEAFLAMTYHRLGHPDRARAYLADFRRRENDLFGAAGIRGQQSEYRALLREAETLIEGKPRPDK